jgi:hypothetical protein
MFAGCVALTAALAWGGEATFTDRHAYVLDATNKRMLRVKLDYTASETVAVP